MKGGSSSNTKIEGRREKGQDEKREKSENII
jgi:hypothetical protein